MASAGASAGASAAADGPLVSIKVDASGEGCSGMFWRTKPDMGATASDPNWPRNGAVHKGRRVGAHPGWVRFENGFWLPTHQGGVQILFEVADAK